MQVNDLEAQSLLQAVDLELTSRAKASRTDARHSDGAMCVRLEDRELWSKFEEHTNEMIVTKSGR